MPARLFPDAHFWAGTGRDPSASGFIVPDENGGQQPLKSYSRKTVVLTLPGDKTVFDIDYLSIWCRQYSADFGHLSIDRRSLNVPPSLKMLGVQPQVSSDPFCTPPFLNMVGLYRVIWPAHNPMEGPAHGSGITQPFGHGSGITHRFGIYLHTQVWHSPAHRCGIYRRHRYSRGLHMSV